METSNLLIVIRGLLTEHTLQAPGLAGSDCDLGTCPGLTLCCRHPEMLRGPTLSLGPTNDAAAYMHGLKSSGQPLRHVLA